MQPEPSFHESRENALKISCKFNLLEVLTEAIGHGMAIAVRYLTLWEAELYLIIHIIHIIHM
jgi:hypothetical protein